MLLSLLLILSIVLVIGLILSPNSSKKPKSKGKKVGSSAKKDKHTEAQRQKLLLNMGKKSREDADTVRLTKLYLFDFGDKKLENFSLILSLDKFEVFNAYIENTLEKGQPGDLFCFKSE